MRNPSQKMENTGCNRRRALQRAFGAGFGLIAGRLAFAGYEFWNQKPASEWTSEDVQRLMTKSPWAKEVNIGRQPDQTRQDGGPLSPDSGSLAPDHSMGGSGQYGGAGGYGRRGGARPNETATVRWESAQPMLDATKETIPAEFAGHYVIAVAGLPVDWAMGRPRRGAPPADATVRLNDLIDRLKAGATLEAKGKDPEGAGIVRRAPSDGAWLFGFSKELLPLGPGDKDIEFTLKAGPMIVRAKFTPKEMTYKGQFAV